MTEISILGTVTLTKDGFHFESVLPDCVVIFEKPMKWQGNLQIDQQACMDFQKDEQHISLPPQMQPVDSGEGYNVKRSTRHYIIQLKVPVVESRAKSESTLQSLLRIAMNAITLDRKELMN